MKMATLAYIEKDDKYLMLHRIKKKNDLHEGKYNGVGGKFEFGESAEDCLKREVFEETGLIATEYTFKGMIFFPDFNGDDEWYTYLYKITGWEGEIDFEGCDEGVLEWKEKSELHKLNMWEGDREFLPWLDGDKFFSAKFIYTPDENGNYKYDRYEAEFY